MTPLISVVIPTFNRLAMLKETLGSVDAQTFQDFEIVVADDGSTDGTLEWLAAERADIRVAKAGGKGAGGARNAGILAARGDYVSLLDSDDLWHPQALEQVAGVLKKYPAAPLIIIREDRFQDEAGPRPFARIESVETEEYATLLDVATSCRGFAGTSVWGAIRREFFIEVGLFREDRGINMEDLDWLLLAGDRGPAVRIGEPALLAYRLHGTQISKDPMQFYRSVEWFLHSEKTCRYPATGAKQRRKYVAAVSLLPIRLLHRRDVFQRSASLLLSMGRAFGWGRTLPWVPRHLLYSLISFLKSKEQHGH